MRKVIMYNLFLLLIYPELKFLFTCILSIYVTRHDILCPNAVKRDVGKTRCKSDLCNCTLLRNLYIAKRHLLTSFEAQEAHFFAKKYLIMD